MKLCGFFARLKCFLAVSCLLVSCGKKAQNGNEQSDNNQQRTNAPVVTDTEAELNRQTVLCEEGVVCPDHIVKIMAFEKKVSRVCTGFLVDDNIVATSSSCLPELLRLKGQDCGKDVTFFFPQSNKRPAERFECDRILQVSELGSESSTLVREDVAFLRLKGKAKDRYKLKINREGIQDGKSFAFWSVEQQNDKKTAFIRRKNCKAVHGSYVSPFSSKETSPNMLFSGCEFKDSDTGAPVTDDRGQVRGVVSKGMDAGVRSYLLKSGLLSNGLNHMLHVTNFSCAPTVFDSQVEDYLECIKPMDGDVLKDLRQAMLNREDLYEAARAKLEEKVSSDSEFLNFQATLKVDGDLRRAELAPKCFKNVSKWIGRLRSNTYTYKTGLPQLALRRTLGPDGLSELAEVDSGLFEFNLQFSVKELKRWRRTDIHFWYGDEGHEIFKSVPECR